MLGIIITLGIFSVFGIIYYSIKKETQYLNNLTKELKEKVPLIKLKNIKVKTKDPEAIDYNFIWEKQNFYLFNEGILLINKDGKDFDTHTEFWYYSDKNENFFKDVMYIGKISVLKFIDENTLKIVGTAKNNKFSKFDIGTYYLKLKFDSDLDILKTQLELADLNYKRTI